MKRFIIFVLSFICLILVMLVTSENELSEIEQLREEVELYNYNVKIQQQEYDKNIEIIRSNSSNILNYINGDAVDVSFLDELQLSDLDYFKYIVSVTNEGSVDILNYQFYNTEENTIIDYYCYTMSKPVVLEIIYNNGVVIDSEIY